VFIAQTLVRPFLMIVIDKRWDGGLEVPVGLESPILALTAAKVTSKSNDIVELAGRFALFRHDGDPAAANFCQSLATNTDCGYAVVCSPLC
jgi:hypothetical protein